MNKCAFNKLFIAIIIYLSISSLLFSREISASLAQVHREQFVEEALSLVGKPYSYGSVGPNSFDCSGLIYYCAREVLDISLPRTSRDQYNACNIISDRDREIGDLVFFKTGYSSKINHVGIYIGNNKFVSALSEGDTPGVRVADLDKNYWKKSYVGTGRFLPSGVHKADDSYNYGVDNNYSQNNNYSNSPNYNSNSSNKENNNKGENKRKTPSFNFSFDDDYYDDPYNDYYHEREKAITSSNSNSTTSSSKNYADKEDIIEVDFNGTIDWSIFSPKIENHPYEKNPNVLTHDLTIGFRGITLGANITFPRIVLNPGFGMNLKYNYGSSVFHISLLLNLSPTDIFRFYIGPTFIFGKPKVPGTNLLLNEGKNVSYNIMFGLSISTPKLKMGGVGVQLVQDISYTDFSNNESFTLEYPKNIYTGLLFSSGVRISL